MQPRQMRPIAPLSRIVRFDLVIATVWEGGLRTLLKRVRSWPQLVMLAAQPARRSRTLRLALDAMIPHVQSQQCKLTTPLVLATASMGAVGR